MSAKINIQEPVLDGGIRSVNYFTGRLLTANDLSREKLAHREADWRLGRALGEGVAYGLEVSIVERGAPPINTAEAQKTPVLRIEPGLAVNRSGQTLALRDPIDLQLVKPTTPISTGASVFEECKPVQSGTYVAGKGVYLLTIMPAEGREGRAPAAGLGNATAPCNTDTILESVKFRHIYLNPFLTSGELDDTNLLRNRVAYRCFGVEEMNAFVTNPFGPPLQRYGLIDELREKKVLSNCDVPLAIFYWTTSGGVEFVDLWAARRRLTRLATSQDWSLVADDWRVSKGQAMFLQFQNQIEEMRRDPKNNPGSINVRDRFRLLPPAGLLPISVEKVTSGFNYSAFFSQIKYRKPIFIEGAQLRPLLQESFDYPPIDVNSGVVVWIYLIRENTQEVLSSTKPPQAYVVFASGHTFFRGEAHYDVHHWNFGNFS